MRLQDKDDIDSEGDEVVMEYVVVANCDSFAAQERGVSTYSIITKDSGNGSLASAHHSILGLLHHGIDYLRRSD